MNELVVVVDEDDDDDDVGGRWLLTVGRPTFMLLFLLKNLRSCHVSMSMSMFCCCS